MKKVLIVDDAKNIRMLLTKCLELEGYQVKTATNGKDALALFSSERFDLAFLDTSCRSSPARRCSGASAPRATTPR